MKKHLLFFIFFLFASPLFAQGYLYYLKSAYPSYKNVYEYFYKNYNPNELPQGTRVHFAKDKDGWWVYTLPYQSVSNLPENKQLLWSVREQRWRFVQMPLRKNKDIPRFIEDFTAKEYEKHFFYGYPTWAEDVIKLLAQETTLPDKYLESLARAYSFQSEVLLFPHAEFQPAENEYDKAFQLKDMPEIKLVNGLKNAELAIQTYERLLKQNPYYNTSAGGIRLKLANEYMSTYFNFMIMGDTLRAKHFLKPNLYEDFFVSFAKNLLNSCEEKAILVTNGDTDTFAILYVQNVLSIRRDVTVVNLSFLQKARYVHYLQNLLSPEQRLDFKIQLKHYQNPLTEILYLANKEIGIKVDFDEIVQDLNKGMQIVTKTLNLTEQIKGLQIEARQWHLPIKEDFKIKLKYFREYLYRQDLALNDLIFSNLALRPIYFATTIDRLTAQPYNDYIYLEGFADKLSTTQSGRFDKVHWDKSYRNLKDNMEWKGIDKTAIKDSAKVQILFNYRYRFSQIAGMLVENGQKFLALAVADQCYELFPNEIIPYDFAMPYLASIYYQLNLSSKGDKILETCMQNIEKYLQTRYTIPLQFASKIREDYYFFADFCDLTAEKFERKSLQQRAVYLKGRVIGG